MNVFIFGANWNNHGDEAAIRALIDELKIAIPNISIKIQYNQIVGKYPYPDIEIIHGFRRPSKRREPIGYILYELGLILGGMPRFEKSYKEYDYNYILEIIDWADIAIFAPGGPTIGDYYRQYQLVDMMLLLRKKNKPYVIYAPSMGPFKKYKGRVRKALASASFVCFREAISQKYCAAAFPNIKTIVTLDSAFQHPYCWKENEMLLKNDKELSRYIASNDKIIGITITDLKWHHLYADDKYAATISEVFHKFIEYVEGLGYSTIFIPQLFDGCNDYYYMKQFCSSNSYIIPDTYDCYFQQHLISKLYAVVGMRYHSNIFSAMVGTPFVSVAYEQKMKGFMNASGLNEFCIDIHDLTYEQLVHRFKTMVSKYPEYKKYLQKKSKDYVKLSHKTTDLFLEIVNSIDRG